MILELENLETLPVPERVQIVEDLWDSIARTNEDVPIPQWQKDELDRRKQLFLRNPNSGRTWDEVKLDMLALR